MKLIMILFILAITNLMASETYSQATKLTLQVKDATVREVLSKIEENSEFFFLYNGKLVDVDRKISMDVNDQKINEILSNIFQGTDVVYAVVDRQIVLTNKANQNGFMQPGSQQTPKITGTVTDKDGAPLPGVNIVVTGTTQGTLTDVAGKYSIDIPQGSKSLIFSFIGMQPQEITIGTLTQINITMVELATALEEVVVIGYGTMKKSNLTYSVSKISEEAISERPLTMISEAFQGQLAGVRAQAQDGVPGEELTIRIRGVNTINGDSNPLYVIDGIPRDNMSDLNANDIASIQILKDAASSAIYGARGGNGVVLIETKKGTGKPTISFESYYGFQQREKELDIMNGEEFVAYNMYMRNLDHLRSGGSMSDPMSERAGNDQIPDYWTTTNTFTDWQKEILKTAPIQNYNVSASAKGDIGNIYFSAGYLNQEGIIKETYYKRMNARMNAEINAGEKLRFGINLSAVSSDSDAADSNKGANGDGKESSIHHALMLTPLMKLDEGTRDWGFPINMGTTYPNPVEQLKQTTDNLRAMRIASIVYGEYDIMEGLIFRSEYGYNHDGSNYEYFQPGNVAYENGYQTTGNSSSTTNRKWVIQNSLNYETFVKEHHINLLLGQSAESQNFYRIYAQASGWPWETLTTLNLATTPISAQTNQLTYRSSSFFGRALYDYKEKYLVTASLRYDGSSRFGLNSKWGIFPSFSAGWKINAEPFMQDVDWISSLKLRASWGMAGNDRIGDYAYMSKLGIYNTSWGNTKVTGVGPSNISNLDLKWESTKTIDLGFDFSVFNNRIQLNLDYYMNTTENLLFDVAIPYTTGFSSYTDNIGSIQNNGWEIDLISQNTIGKFDWSTSFNLSRNRNKVLNMGEISQFTTSSWDALTITKVSESLSQFYAYKTDGLLTSSDFDAEGNALVPILVGQEEGTPRYVDVSMDGKITTDDYVMLGNNLPDLIYGISNRFSWKNFDLNILLQGQLGGKVLFLGSRQYDTPSFDRNIFSRWLRSYKRDYETIYGPGENPIPTEYLEKHGIDLSWDGVTPNSVGTADNNDDRRIYDTSYLRIKNISLGYTIPNRILRNTVLSSVKLYISVDNIKTFDNYPGFSPETNSYGNNTTKMGLDYSSYPLSRRIIFGANINF